MKKITMVCMVLAGLMISQDLFSQVRVNVGIGMGRPWRYRGFYHRQPRVIVSPPPVIVAEPACVEPPVVIAPAPVVVVAPPPVVYVRPRYYERRHFRHRRW